MISFDVWGIAEKPNNFARVYRGMGDVARRGASQSFSYSGYYFIRYISIGRAPSRTKPEPDNRKAISPPVAGWVCPVLAA
jgi:hypothetical protein